MKEEIIEKINEKANYCLNCKIKPCSKKGCPLENDIPTFIKAVKEENYEEAFNILLETTILQPICGRICPHKSQCEGSCVRGIKGESVQIGELEAFVGDMAIKNNYKINVKDLNGKKVAVVGGGPCGLTASYFLRKEGYDVTIYEKYSYLGGLLVHGIPEFRLEKDLVNNWINKILSLGINVEYNKELGNNCTLEDLEEKYDAVLLAFGANISSKMNIPGEDLKGVYGGNELLEFNLHPDYKGKKVAVIGGGNVAMDTARTINKMGAEKTYVIYRRAEEQMPAERKEIEDAKKEGVEFLFQNNIVKIIPNDNNEVNKIECIKTELIQRPGETRKSPVNIEGSNYIMDMDYVVMAIGSCPEKKVIDTINISTGKGGYIECDENYKTSREKVFVAGDLSGEKSTVAYSARSGGNAAKEIDKMLSI